MVRTDIRAFAGIDKDEKLLDAETTPAGPAFESPTTGTRRCFDFALISSEVSEGLMWASNRVCDEARSKRVTTTALKAIAKGAPAISAVVSRYLQKK